MSIQFWLVPSRKRNRTHIIDFGKRAYYCGVLHGWDTLQGPLRKPEMKLCKNCIRVFKARRGVEP